MIASRPHDVRRLSIRVALTATALVAAAYLAVAVAVIAIVTRNLTTQIDGRLSQDLEHVPHEPFPGTGRFDPPPPDRPFGPVLLVWTVKADGTVFTPMRPTRSCPRRIGT